MVEMKGGEFNMVGLHDALIFAPLVAIGAIILGILWLVNRWRNPKGKIITTQEKFELDPKTNKVLRHSKVITTQEQL